MFTVSHFQINVGNVKVLQISGTSSFVIGKSRSYYPASNSNQNNGVGSTYGDGNDNDMSPYQLDFNKPNPVDPSAQVQYNPYHYPYTYPPYQVTPQMNDFYKKKT